MPLWRIGTCLYTLGGGASDRFLGSGEDAFDHLAVDVG
jgi:hypothetical protein